MKTRSFPLFILLTFLFSSCFKSDLNNGSGDGKNPPVVPSTVNKSLLLDLVNFIRKNGCNCGPVFYPPVQPVTWNDQLEAAAYSHSSDMNQNNFFGHTSEDGSNAGDRITRAGYNWKAYGENIAQGYTIERSVVEGWLASEEHCKNMMNKIFTEMGVARAGTYWTQDFATR